MQSTVSFSMGGHNESTAIVPNTSSYLDSLMNPHSPPKLVNCLNEMSAAMIMQQD